jgi:hypothetical protein
MFDSIQRPRWSYSFGVLLDYNFNKHWGLELGVFYSQKGTQQNTMILLHCSEFHYEAVNYELTKTRDKYLDIPPGLSYRLQLTGNQYPLFLSLSGGGLYETLVQRKKVEFMYYGNWTYPNSWDIDSVVYSGAPFKIHKLGFYFSASVEKAIAKRWSISASLWFRKVFHSWYKWEIFKDRLYYPVVWDYSDVDCWPWEIAIDELPYSLGIRADVNFRISKSSNPNTPFTPRF